MNGTTVLRFLLLIVGVDLLAYSGPHSSIIGGVGAAMLAWFVMTFEKDEQ